MLLTCNREVHGWNLRRNCRYPDSQWIDLIYVIILLFPSERRFGQLGRIESGGPIAAYATKLAVA
jgi:hypothetical protein